MSRALSPLLPRASLAAVVLLALLLSGGAQSAHCGAAGKCKPSQTCCAQSTGGVGCCPFAKAVCCGNGQTCCREGFECASGGGCRPKNATATTAQVFISQAALLEPEPLAETLELNSKAAEAVEAVECPDGSRCPNGATCCRSGGGYGCCPYPSAICCSDGQHCCPQGYTCDPSSGMCNAPAFLFREPIKQLRPSGALAPTKAPVHCSKDFACPENNTCCRTKFGGFACCPLKNATCCSDGAHCCEGDKVCNMKDLTCDDPPSGRAASVPLAQKFLALRASSVFCPAPTAGAAPSECPAASTCCGNGECCMQDGSRIPARSLALDSEEHAPLFV